MPSIKQAAETMLNNVILPFWMRLKDEEHGGYYGLVDFDLQVDKTAEKGCILNSRILWFFSEAAILTGRADVAACARHAYEWFEAHCFDQEHGGVYWSCDYLGRPLDTTKHTYNQGFAIYALSAYYRLTGELRALTRALEIFRLIENRCTDAEGYLEAFTVDWQPESNEKLSENGVMAEKTMNTLLHVFEGYAGLYQASRDPSVGQAMRRILEIYADKIYSPELHRQLVFFDKHYHLIIDLYSYGHDIESSWLIDWGCALLGDAALTAKITAPWSGGSTSTPPQTPILWSGWGSTPCSTPAPSSWTANSTWWPGWRATTARAFLRWPRAAPRWTASASGTSPSSCPTPAPTRPTSMICG